MAKKKLFGNRSDPRCETCARGKLTSDGSSVLCCFGGALPLSHSCRRYRYDPLRRVPKRRPLLDEYSAADFALDETVIDEAPVSVEKDAAAPTADPTLTNLLSYLREHDSPDADTILAILNKPTLPENTVEPSCDGPATDSASLPQDSTQVPAEAPAVLLQPDDSPDIFGDLARLDIALVKSTASDRVQADFLTLSADEIPAPVLLTADESVSNDVLRADDLLLIAGEVDPACDDADGFNHDLALLPEE